MHPDRQRIVDRSQPGNKSGGAHKPGNKKKRPQRQPQDDAVLDQTNSQTKKRMRDLARELSHKADMPMTLRREKDRELEALRVDLELGLRKKARNLKITRYHHVRFFERQKATRALKQAQKTAAVEPADSPRREELQAAVHEAEVNLNYTMYFPLVEKYVSLWSKSGTGAGFKSTTWYLVEAAMATKGLQELRDRMSEEDQTKLDQVSGISKWNDLVIRATKGLGNMKLEGRQGGADGAGNGMDDQDEEDDADGDAAMEGTGGFFGR